MRVVRRDGGKHLLGQRLADRPAPQDLHVERGESFLVCRRNAPVAELRPVRRERTKARPMGLAKGRLRIPPAFFKPLPRDLLDAFEGKGR